jgi:adenylyl-sulfate kinase
MSYLVHQNFTISRSDYEQRHGHKGMVIWFTGLSGSGKSTLANEFNSYLFNQGKHSFILDGDNTRLGINHDLTFSNKDRTENNRRIAEIAKLFVEAGHIVLCSFISPFKEDRNLSKQIIGEADYFEVYVNSSLNECERRDVKGMYKKARNGELESFTGISSPYEVPENPNLVLDTEHKTIQECLNQLISSVEPIIVLKN